MRQSRLSWKPPRHRNQARQGLLGFGVERADPAEHERYPMPGYKVFKSIIPLPDENTRVSTMDHPVQSFVWDDFTAKPDHLYEYFFHPLRGKPKNLDRTAPPFSIKVRTEPLYSNGEHDIFFNRGVVSSQAYAHQYGNLAPDKQPTQKKRVEALQWLTRDLDEAILKFIASANAGDGLLCCFYEFRYQPVADALKKAIDKGVDVKIIVDAKVNELTDKKGVFHESFPREDNLRTIKAAKLPKARIILRDHNPADIQHDKFMVRQKGAAKTPTEVWTGSTNISLGGLAGQTNVGHWVRNPAVAAKFEAYWKLLKNNPGSAKGDTAAAAKTKKAAYRTDVQGLVAVPPALAAIAAGVTPVFSPRASQPVYVHCQGGRHRTGVMTAVYRMTADGWTADRAFAEMKQYKFGADFLHPEFKTFVYGYHPELPRAAPAQAVVAAKTTS